MALSCHNFLRFPNPIINKVFYTPGGVIIVSHDERLIRDCNCQLWVIEEQGIAEVEGGFEDYRKEVARGTGTYIGTWIRTDFDKLGLGLELVFRLELVLRLEFELRLELGKNFD